MPRTVTTNDPRGLGYQTGYFAGVIGDAVDQAFFDKAFAGRINENKIYKNAYNCNIIGETDLANSNMSSWLEEFGGVEYDCHPAYTNLEYNSIRHQIRASLSTTIPTRAGGTGTIKLSNKDHFVSGQYVLPQVGNAIVLTPSGFLADVTQVTFATANDTTITVRQRSTTAAAQSVVAGDEMLVLQGAELQDCAIPTGQFNFRDLPTEIDLQMFDFASRGELCGDALEKCQFLKIPFIDENGVEIAEKSAWFTEAQQDMFRDHEMRKHYEKMLNPSFGVIPQLRARGIKFSPDTTTEITLDDIRFLKQQLDIAGVAGREYAVFAGRNIFSQFQRLMIASGVVQLDNSLQPLNDCKWLNMEWCGIKLEGLTLHIYEENTFSNGKLLGSVGMNFPNSAIFVPMWNKERDTTRSVSPVGRNGYTEKMFSTVYFQSIQGRRYDMFTDSNGILNGPTGRNTFATGEKKHEWSVETRFLLETHCMNAWIYIGL
jgi:hypothetical protein